MRGMKWLLENTLLRFGLSQPFLLLAIVLMIVIGAFSLYPQMSKDFLPAFKEETALIAATSAPGTSLEEMNKISDVLEQQILSVPEVRKVGRRLGRAERGDHVVPVSTAEFDVDFREAEGQAKRQGAQPQGDPRRPQPSACARVPGVFAVVSGPLADRIGHMLSRRVARRWRSRSSGRISTNCASSASRCRRIAKTIPGFEDAKLDQQSSIPQLRIEADRDRAAAYGIAPGHLNEQLSALIGGKEVAELRDGQRTVNLVMRLPDRVARFAGKDRAAARRDEHRPAHPAFARGRRARGQGAERHLPRKQPAPFHHRDQADGARCRRARGAAAKGSDAKR